MLAELMHYTQVADQRLIAIFQSEAAVPAKAVSLFCHVLNAQHIWANRLLGHQPKYGVWENYETALFAEISKNNFELFDQVFQTIPMDKQVTYTTSNGAQFTDVAKDILFHAINHSTYHRAQIATLFKAEGLTPPITDYIILKRNHQL